MPTPEKEAVIREMEDKLKRAKAVVFVDYRGLNVKEDTELRQKLRKAGIEYRVAKNTLTGIAAKNVGLSGLDQYLAGPTSIALSYDDVVAPAKVIADFAKEKKKMELKGGILEGKAISSLEVKALANLPSKEVLVAQVIGTLQAPLTGLVRVVQGPIRKLVYAVDAIQKAKSEA